VLNKNTESRKYHPSSYQSFDKSTRTFINVTAQLNSKQSQCTSLFTILIVERNNNM